MQPQINVNKRDVLNLQEKLAMLAMPPKKRIWMLKALGRWEKANVRQRIRQQKDIHGKALEPKKGKKRGKVMRRMAKGLTPYVRGGKELDLTWGNKLTARIAARHHLGQKQKMTKRQMQKRWGTPDYTKPCTRGQARKLRELGYTVPKKKGKGRKKPSLRQLMESITHGQAGQLIRDLSNQPTVAAWDIPLKERQILGSNEREVNRELVQIFEQARQRK
ncbi:TPA: virion morphogenesis protein [Vibrio parahaemolyticus]|uniref:virion morphogenesis protein n=1 Tax=Vibrio parahaemolyticus TaxID=670 RepID=UPI0004A2897C|nr:virion morphogenesis protein [Vibrio parahaemolyticus]MBE4138087.1 virion morphogenesis protein [Vibrio parahaemolyticus]TOZ80030.1 virion morphogenesis protein [Vibrio parahaemolyticus]HCH3319026.1 virion morphogenesis protein [Vibrio parahaemolyticus]HCH6587257.1 virion morphogenesis protein [Vibrio parahaemolyticus]